MHDKIKSIKYMNDDGKIVNIDILIKLFSSTTTVGYQEIHNIHKEETDKLIKTMTAMGIIIPTDRHEDTYTIGPVYYEIIRHGSFKSYHEYEKEKLLLNKGLLESSLQTNTSLINTNASLIKTNKSVRVSNIIMPIILGVTLLATCGQIAVTWLTSESGTRKIKIEQLEQMLQQRDTQLKKLEGEIKNLQLKLDSISQ